MCPADGPSAAQPYVYHRLGINDAEQDNDLARNRQGRALIAEPRWHYQWIVIHEFLPPTVGQELVANVLAHGPRYYSWQDRPFIPIEFFDAAHRYGRSQIRELRPTLQAWDGDFAKEAEAAHVEQEKQLGYRDEEWVPWYASFKVDRLREDPIPGRGAHAAAA